LKAIKAVCHANHLRFHLDGARLFNALIAHDQKPEQFGALFDSVSICLSKGLGAPVGSLIIGDQELIDKILRFRKLMGGGMRQAGYLAAAGIYALDHHVERLKQDHIKARKLENALNKAYWVAHVLPVETNIVVAELKAEIDVNEVLEHFKAMDIKAVPFGGQKIRMVTHLDIDEEALEKALYAIEALYVPT
jgi:threonine aldolase